MYKFLVMFFLSTLTLSSHAEIIETDKFQDIQTKFSDLVQNYDAKDILGIVGISQVLTKLSSPAFYQTDPQLVAITQKAMNKLKPKFNETYINDILMTEYKNELIDEEAPQIIQNIQKTGVRLIAFTNTLTGNFNKIERLEVWVADSLKKFGFDFSNSFPNNNEFVFKEYNKYLGTYPIFYRGIFNCNINKGYNGVHQLLTSFLTNLNITPKVIVMIDSNIGSLHTMDFQLKNLYRNIEFIGINYTAAKITDNQSSDGIDPKEFLNFWYNFIDKVNKVKRIIDSDDNNPYDK